ncbi:hypothetical protein SAMD00079811_03800 [Scytonema sp. HK-05]|uniref:hypothetical protein n=1 Tax=Scytonema sp. HK-05 TaxID=1137095 RepID=UPI000B5E5818|nr:hypothetical protein [Scytonema sp. HK-05]BAY42802.1 hypothetical protein SAMD00079811_03800 [Scytonema sp. HK-05]
MSITFPNVCTVHLFYQSVCVKWMVVTPVPSTGGTPARGWLTNVASQEHLIATGITIIDFIGLSSIPGERRLISHPTHSMTKGHYQSGMSSSSPAARPTTQRSTVAVGDLRRFS